MKIIMLSGKSGTGKNYIANIYKNYLENITDQPIEDYAKNIPIDDLIELKGYNLYNPILLALADSVKYICKNYFDWDEIKDKKGRDLLINIGTYCGKDFAIKKLSDYVGRDDVVITNLYNEFCKLLKPSINLWSGILKDKILYLNGKYKSTITENIFIITDVRFKDEILYQKLIFGDDVITIRIKENHRTNYIDDISEKDLDDYNFDYYIDNDKDDDRDYIIEQLKKIKL